MTLLIILLAVFAGVGLMVVIGEKHGRAMEPEQQAKFAKISRILVFIILIVAIVKGLADS